MVVLRSGAAVAVAIQTAALGHFPWLGLTLAVTFCLYGFLRKIITVGPTQGFLVEGVDIFAKPGDGVGLSCRLYRTPDGLAGAPTMQELRAALGVAEVLS